MKSFLAFLFPKSPQAAPSQDEKHPHSYTMEYSSKGAIVYKDSKWGRREVATFTYGVEALDYINTKNALHA